MEELSHLTIWNFWLHGTRVHCSRFRRVTSIKATWQATCPLGYLNVCTYTLYRLVVFWVLFHFIFASPPFPCSYIFTIITVDALGFWWSLSTTILTCNSLHQQLWFPSLGLFFTTGHYFIVSYSYFFWMHSTKSGCFLYHEYNFAFKHSCLFVVGLYFLLVCCCFVFHSLAFFSSNRELCLYECLGSCT